MRRDWLLTDPDFYIATFAGVLMAFGIAIGWKSIAFATEELWGVALFLWAFAVIFFILGMVVWFERQE